MKLENQVCSQIQAKKLKELGVVQATEKYWIKDTKNNWVLHVPHPPAFPQEYADTYAAAFTVAELGVMLPWDAESGRCSSAHTEYTASAMDCSVTWEENEAQARAALLIELLSTGKITAEEVNQRLIAA